MEQLLQKTDVEIQPVIVKEYKGPADKEAKKVEHLWERQAYRFSESFIRDINVRILNSDVTGDASEKVTMYLLGEGNWYTMPLTLNNRFQYGYDLLSEFDIVDMDALDMRVTAICFAPDKANLRLSFQVIKYNDDEKGGFLDLK